MKKILVKSVHDTFDYVMDHYYPQGCEEQALRKDTYVIISIQDSQNGGFGIRFTENEFCQGVLTLLFDDVWKDVEGAVSFSEEMARQIICFIQDHKKADTLVIHCYAGQSRSRAVGAFALKMLGGDNRKYLEKGSANALVYETLLKVYGEQFPNPEAGSGTSTT